MLKQPTKDVLVARLYYLEKDCAIIRDVINGENGAEYIGGNLEHLQRSLDKMKRLSALIKEGVEEVEIDVWTGLDKTD